MEKSDEATEARSDEGKNCELQSPSSLRRFVASSLTLLFVGCSPTFSGEKSSALDGTDLVRMTDDMSMKLAGDPEVQHEIAAHGALKIVVEPVENQMTAEVLPRGPAEAFTGRIRSLLSKHARDQYVWVMNRDAFYRLRAQELDFDLGPSPDAVNPQYALTARFSSLTSEDAKRRASYYLCVYVLTDLEKRTVLWTDKYEVKKSVVKGFLD